MKKNLYLIGKTGLVSKYLKKSFKFSNTYSIRNLKRSQLSNIKSNDTVFLLSNPGGLDFCQNNKKEVRKFLRVDFIFDKLQKKTKLIFISSDAVYSKKLEYGKMKLEIEKKIKKKFDKFCILRVCKIFSKNLRDKSEYTKVYKNLKKKRIYNAFIDQYCHYIEIKDLINIIKKLIDNNKKNRHGVTNIFDKNIYLSRYEFAKKVANKYFLHEKYIKPIKVSSSNLPLPKKIFLKNNFNFF